MKFHRKFWFLSLSALFVFTIVWDVFLYTFPEKTTPWNFLYNVMYGAIFFTGGAIAIKYGIGFSLKTNLGKMLFFLGLGLLSFWGGNVIWVYYTFFLKVPIPYPSLADGSYALLPPLMTIGMVYLIRVYKTLLTKNVIRDSIIIIIISFIAIFGFFAKPNLSPELPFIQNFFSVYFPFGDVVIISIALISLRIGGGKMHPSLYIFSFGLVLQTIADLLFTYRIAVETYWNGDISDLFYTLSAYTMSVGLFEIIHSLSQVSDSAPIQSASS